MASLTRTLSDPFMFQAKLSFSSDGRPDISGKRVFVEEGKRAAGPASKDVSKEVVSSVTDPLFRIPFDLVPESVPEDENIYLTTNETEQPKTLAIMRNEKLVGNTLLAVSSFFGLNVAAIRGEEHGQTLDYLIIIDRSIRVQNLWQEIQKIILRFSRREEALEAIKSTLLEQAENFWPSCKCPHTDCLETAKIKAVSYIKDLEAEIVSGVSWLSSQTKYAKIKHIFDKGHFVFKRINLFDTINVSILSQTIKKLGLVLDTAYLVREYAENRDCLPKYQDSMAQLRQTMTDETLIIDTEPRMEGIHCDEDELTQRVIRGVVSMNIRDFFAPSPSSSCFSPPSSPISSSRSASPSFSSPTSSPTFTSSFAAPASPFSPSMTQPFGFLSTEEFCASILVQMKTGMWNVM